MEDIQVKRINADISLELYNKLKDKIPWGLQSDAIRKLLALLIDYMEEEGTKGLLELLEGELKLNKREL